MKNILKIMTCATIGTILMLGFCSTILEKEKGEEK